MGKGYYISTWEEEDDYYPTGYERCSDESDEDYQERMEDYESFIDYNND